MRRGKKTTKVCKNCEKDFEALMIKVRVKKALFCSRECYNFYRSKNKKNPKERARIHQKKFKYNLNEEEYKFLFTKQNNKCAICTVDLSSVKACVDHNHKTKKVRGILCDSCNRALGFLKDDLQNLKRAVEYLKKDINN